MDTGLLCALLNIRSEEDLRQSPAVGAVWETFVFAQLRARERIAGHTGSIFFWRDRTREVDFVVDAGGRLELFEAKWTELPDLGDTVNLDFVRSVLGNARVMGGTVVARTPNSLRISCSIVMFVMLCMANIHPHRFMATSHPLARRYPFMAVYSRFVSISKAQTACVRSRHSRGRTCETGRGIVRMMSSHRTVIPSPPRPVIFPRLRFAVTTAE
jgi:hypothetical protein